MTAGNDDVWSARRRLGETLRRWATPARREAPAPHAKPPAKLARLLGPSAGIDQHALRRCLRRTVVPARWRRTARWCPTAPFLRQDRVGRDRGAATIFVLAVGLVLVLMGVAGAAVGAARVGRHRAQAAADLGALAGAARAIEGDGPACAQAVRFVQVNAGLVTSCEVRGLEIIVRTEVTVTPLPGLTRHATAAARAGPVYATGS